MTEQVPDGGYEGVPATPSGYSAEPEPCSTVSAVPVSIPNATDALQSALPWLRMIASEKDRPETSDIHAVIAEVEAAIAMEPARDE
jgi:hypothetical protein